MDPNTIKRKLYEATSNASKGNWDVLNYKIINAAKMRNFIKYINMTGNSIECNQNSVTGIEDTLIQYKTYDIWKANNTVAVRDGLARAFAYLYSHLTIEAGEVNVEEIFSSNS